MFYRFLPCVSMSLMSVNVTRLWFITCILQLPAIHDFVFNAYSYNSFMFYRFLLCMSLSLMPIHITLSCSTDSRRVWVWSVHVFDREQLLDYGHDDDAPCTLHLALQLFCVWTLLSSLVSIILCLLFLLLMESAVLMVMYLIMPWVVIIVMIRKEGRKGRKEALNTFYLRLYGVRHMFKDHSDSEKGNPLPPHRLLLSINSKGSFIYIIPQTG